MSTHPDAGGFLNDLAKEVNVPWFKMVCDIATVCGVSVLDQSSLDTLFALFTGKASYIGIKPASGAVASVEVPATPGDFLEHLSGFANFKRLGDSLEICFKKRITLIFGVNGSGKSSLCDSLKVISTPEQPNRPLENVCEACTTSPSFVYKFKHDKIEQTWTPTAGFGPRRATVKYFDTAVAIQNVTNSVDPGRVIILTPFKLHVFEWVKAMTTQFRATLQQAQQDNSTKLTQSLTEIRADYARFKGFPLAVIEAKTFSILPNQIKIGEEFTDKKLLDEKQTVAAELEKGASEEGLRMLRAEHRELESFLASLNKLLSSAAELWILAPESKAKTLVEKQAAQELLATALIPKGKTLDDLLALLRIASPICKMDDAAGHSCPLCKRDLGDIEVELFKQYHGLLVGELEKDIALLKSDITKARKWVTVVEQVDRDSWDKCKTIQQDVLLAAKAGADLIIACCDISKEPTAEAKSALESLNRAADTWAKQLELKKKAIEAAAMGRGELVNRLATLRAEIEPLEYAQAVAERLDKLRETQRIASTLQFWSAKLPEFTYILKRLTEKAKEAHEALVVMDFEDRLDAEYKALAEKGMAEFGVVLARKGADASVTVLPQVGKKNIEGVLSEGELRIHALALFFAELETCPQSVLVFDDPISSFDYNYIANYCARLRDFTLKHPSKQIIVLTHNWEFFVQFQTTINQSGLNSHLSVHVLENCTVVADYSDKIVDLKKDIDVVLAAPGEPSKAKKEETAGKMRRLIESVVNAHVFNHQRHQYKQKSQALTAFQSFTKVVPLLPTEATILHDLYAKLSITEHDDPRTAYVNSDKAMFQTRYDKILDIETAIESRIP